jgi:hypothetical protein
MNDQMATPIPILRPSVVSTDTNCFVPWVMARDLRLYVFDVLAMSAV